MEQAKALVYNKEKNDFRIKWTGEAGTFESGHQYVTREKATLVAISAFGNKVGSAKQVEQDYGAV